MIPEKAGSLQEAAFSGDDARNGFFGRSILAVPEIPCRSVPAVSADRDGDTVFRIRFLFNAAAFVPSVRAVVADILQDVCVSGKLFLGRYSGVPAGRLWRSPLNP